MGHENGGWMNDDQRDAAKADALFPIMGEKFGTRLGYVPMAVMRRHNAQAMRNHGGQSVERLRERGGLSAQEAMAVVNGTKWEERRWHAEAPAWANLQLVIAPEFPGFNFSTGDCG